MLKCVVDADADAAAGRRRAAHGDGDRHVARVQGQRLPHRLGHRPRRVGGVDDQVVGLVGGVQPDLVQPLPRREPEARAQPVVGEQRVLLRLDDARAAGRPAPPCRRSDPALPGTLPSVIGVAGKSVHIPWHGLICGPGVAEAADPRRLPEPPLPPLPLGVAPSLTPAQPNAARPARKHASTKRTRMVLHRHFPGAKATRPASCEAGRARRFIVLRAAAYLMM